MPALNRVALTVADRERSARFFGFGSADEVRAARERFRAAGVPETEWQDDHIVIRVQVADPDGYRVELFAFP